MKWAERRKAMDRPLDEDAVYWIRLWYLGRYNGATALRRLNERQISRILHRSMAQVESVLAPYRS